ncbi:MAG: mucoidy inhibitor MuiA family protein [Ignavibacteriales bacterium]|nr:mucoidy inhibitor MuiA family protein [Ignavibacteriales bacterium]
MKKIFWYTMVISCAALFSRVDAATPRRELSSSITSVTVYLDRAAVTRTAKTSLQPGAQTLSFSGLPFGIIDNSVRVSGESAGAKIIDVRVEPVQSDTIPEERLRELTDRLTTLRDQQQEVVDRMGTVTSERDFVLQIKAQSSDNISKDLKIQRPTPEDWQRVIIFLDQNLTRFASEIRKLTKERSLLQEKIDALQRQIDMMGARRMRASKNVLVRLEVAKAGEATIGVTYVVSDARWTPQYDVRVSPESNAVDLTYAGTIVQRTGEDWSNIDVSLSTARPDVSGIKPDLSPWYLSIAEQQHLLKSMRMMRADKMDFAGAVAENANAVISSVDAEVVSQLVSAQFHIKAPATIPSDNSPVRVLITQVLLSAERSYSSAPKLTPFVYAKAAVKNISEFPFLPGVMNVFAGSDFVASSSMKAVAPGESFDVYLGVDPLMKIERTLVNKMTEYTGTFTRSVRITYEYRFTLENTRKSAQSVTIQDQLPLSQNEKIIITQLEPSEKDLKKDEQGMVTWTMSLNPSGKQTWKFLFSIEYPQGTPLTGVE